MKNRYRFLSTLLAIFTTIQSFWIGSMHAAESPSYTVIEDRATHSVITPDLSQRKVLKIRLANGLEAYIVSDPKTDKSGAVLSVDAGSWNEPRENPGLAHFLEHMLFLGTKKYPGEGEYHRFINEHGGIDNAYTANSYTSYMFSVDNSAFSEALDRFSWFFKEPLFNPSGVSRELRAIDQEYAKNLENDSWRSSYVEKELANPDTPYRSFDMGNSETLSKVSRETLEKFYKEHYSANLMHLVVYSSLSIDQLRDLVVEDFSAVPSTKLTKTLYDKPVLDNSTQNKIVYIEPVQNTRNLSVVWELPAQFADMKETHPMRLVCYVLGHEGEESLLAQLKREGLAENLACGTRKVGGKVREFIMDVTLTDEGVNEVYKVIDRIFQTINNFKEKGAQRYLFDEIARMDVIDYQYQSREDLFSLMRKHADWITDEELSTYPEQTLIIQKFDPNAIEALLHLLTPQSAHFYLEAPSSLTHVRADRHEKWLGAAYSIQAIPKEVYERWAGIPSHPSIDLPVANPFIPHNLSLVAAKDAKKQENKVIPRPDMLVNDEHGKVYFAMDDRYQVPRISVNFEIRTPQVEMGNPAKVVLCDLYAKSVTEALKQWSYPASIAGLDYNVACSKYGVAIHINGYGDNADLLLDMVLKQLQEVHPTENEFNIYKDSLRRDYQNFMKQSPLDQAIETLKAILYKEYATEKQKASAITRITYEKFNDYINDLFAKTYIVGAIYGNLSQESALALSDKVFAAFEGTVFPKDKQKRPQVILLPQKEGPFLWETSGKMQGNAVILAVESPISEDPAALGRFDFKMRAVQQVLMQAMKEPFFSALRTKQQTAYMVYSDGQEIEKQMFNIFAVQSNTHATRDLLARFELFIEEYLQELDHIVTETKFNAIKEVLIRSLEQPVNDTAGMGALLFKLAFEYDGDFDWMDKRIQGIKELTYQEFLAQSKAFMGRNNKRRVSVLFKGVIPPENIFNYMQLKNLSVLRRMSNYN